MFALAPEGPARVSASRRLSVALVEARSSGLRWLPRANCVGDEQRMYPADGGSLHATRPLGGSHADGPVGRGIARVCSAMLGNTNLGAGSITPRSVAWPVWSRRLVLDGAGWRRSQLKTLSRSRLPLSPSRSRTSLPRELDVRMSVQGLDAPSSASTASPIRSHARCSSACPRELVRRSRLGQSVCIPARGLQLSYIRTDAW